MKRSFLVVAIGAVLAFAACDRFTEKITPETAVLLQIQNANRAPVEVELRDGEGFFLRNIGTVQGGDTVTLILSADYFRSSGTYFYLEELVRPGGPGMVNRREMSGEAPAGVRRQYVLIGPVPRLRPEARILLVISANLAETPHPLIFFPPR